MRKKNFLEVFGIILMILGILIILLALPLISMSILQIGPAGISAEVPQIKATQIIIGVVLFFLGIISYKTGKSN